MKTGFGLKILLVMIFYGTALNAVAGGIGCCEKWVSTWAAAPQLAAGNDMPQDNDLSDCSLRQVVRVSVGGDTVRLRLSNEYSKEPVEIKSVYIAYAKDSSEIDVKTAKHLTFNKRKNVTISAGGTAVSDELKFELKPLSRISITIDYGKTPAEATSHLGSRTTSYIIKGVSKPKSDFSICQKVEHWYNISAIDVKGVSAGAIAVIGNSITDGRGSTTDMQNRWTDAFADALAANGVGKAVLNLGIGGNCVLEGGLGTPALDRYDRDILSQCGVETVVIFEGVNDIGCCGYGIEKLTQRLIDAYKLMAEKAHKRGLKVYGATITPFKGHSYYTHFHEAARQTVNDWIRNSDCFDGVIDFDKAVRDASDPAKIDEKLQQDWLHLNAEGYKLMGKYAAEVIVNPTNLPRGEAYASSIIP